MKIPKIPNLRPKHPQQWSITWRLAWIYILSAFLILLITTLSLYWVFTYRLEKENYQFLENKILALQKILQMHPNPDTSLSEEIVFEPTLYHYYSRIVDRNGRIIIETPHMSDLVPVTAFNRIEPKQTGPFRTLYLNLPEKKGRESDHFLLMNATIHENGNRIIQMAMDISSEHEIIEDYRQDLLIILLIGILVSALVGIIVTRKGLQPLREMTQSTQKITVAQLKVRLDPSSWPRELYNLAIAFNEMLDRIEEGVDRLSQFSGDLAHELRTPINNLMGEAEIALSRPRTNEEYKAVLESSLEEFQILTYMIESLLFLAHAENPAEGITAVTLSARKIIDDIGNFFEAMAEERGVQITCEGEAEVIADPLMLRRALNNLVLNALKYTPRGGQVKLSIRSDQSHVYIAVSDNGEGILPEHLPHLFDRFYRVDAARSKQTGGMGLGLAIVKSIMDLHKGKVTISSQKNKGTTVTLAFPKPAS